MRIEAVDLPGRACAPHDTPARYDNVHVAVQRGREPFQPVPGDAPSGRMGPPRRSPPARGRTARSTSAGRSPRGVAATGSSTTWGTVGDAREFAMFRRAKLHLADVDPATRWPGRRRGGALVARLGLTDGGGLPSAPASGRRW